MGAEGQTAVLSRDGQGRPDEVVQEQGEGRPSPWACGWGTSPASGTTGGGHLVLCFHVYLHWEAEDGKLWSLTFLSPSMRCLQ